MPDIKTREVVRGTVKAIDKSAVAGERMKQAYIRTKDKAEHGLYSAENSPNEYAADQITGTTERVTHETIHQFDRMAAEVWNKPKTTYTGQRIILKNDTPSIQMEVSRSRIFPDSNPAPNSRGGGLHRNRPKRKRSKKRQRKLAGI